MHDGMVLNADLAIDYISIQQHLHQSMFCMFKGVIDDASPL
jgi:hypothetical protein